MKSAAALLLLDVISDFEFPDADRLFNHAASMLPRLTALKARVRQAGIPTVYVNDNFGRWTSDFRRLLDHCLSDAVRGEPIARALAPLDDDYSVLKPKHSGFFGTSLELVLNYLGVSSLIITGFTRHLRLIHSGRRLHAGIPLVNPIRLYGGCGCSPSRCGIELF